MKFSILIKNIKTAFYQFVLLICFILSTFYSTGQGMKWANDGNSYYRLIKNELVQYTLPENQPKVVITRQ